MVIRLDAGACDDSDLFMVIHLDVGACDDFDPFINLQSLTWTLDIRACDDSDPFIVIHLDVGACVNLDPFIIVAHLDITAWDDFDLFIVTHLDVGACDDFDSFCTVSLPGLFLLEDDVTGLVLAANAPCAIVGATLGTLSHSSKGGFPKVFKQCFDFVWGCHFQRYSSTC